MNPRARSIRATVLVVDDEQMSRDLIARILREHGCVVRTASGTTEAYAALEFGDIDIMLCDVVMPDESGPEFLARLRTEMPALPVVMVSGVANTSIAQVALELGAYGYVTKPFSASQLVIAVANAVHRRTLERENESFRLRAGSVPSGHDRPSRDSGSAFGSLTPPRRSLGDAASDVLARAIEGGSLESGDHVARVGEVARLIAEAIGLPRAACDEIGASTVFHDVGKIGMPTEILWKPGALTVDEFELVKQHAELGRRILASSSDPSLVTAASIALTHHERWDGSGYPRGLTGTAIPIEGRIAAIADVFDVLVNRSVYRARLELGPALDIMRDGRGTQFDPDVLDAFLDRVGGAARILERS